MEVASALVIWAALGAICYIMAKNRGRDVIKGVIAGILVGGFAIIYYWLVGDTTELRIKKAEGKK